MNNLYFIESDNYELLNIKVRDLLNKLKLSNDNLIVYDMELTDIKDAIIDLDTYNFFGDKKVVLCKNAIFLTNKKCEINHHIDMLEKYLNNPNPNNILIISSSKVDGKKNIVKLVKNTCKIIEANIDVFNYVKEKTAGYTIDDATIRYFLTNTGEDLANIDNEINKLLSLKDDDKVITKSDIDLITIKKIDCNIYELIDAIINKDKHKSLTIYQEMVNYGEDVFKIFVSLANQIRLIYQVKMLKNLTNEEICDKLNLKNIKQVIALRYKINNYSSNDLISYLHKLSIMDQELKTGKCIDQIIFPVFIANL